MSSDPFRDQVVIITGASTGIGRSLALQLAGQGAKVAIAARRTGRLEQVADECRSLGGEILVIPTDVGCEADCKDLVDRTIAVFGKLDMLINNAGLAASALFDEFPDLALFKHTMDINFFGAVHCTYYALPHIKKTLGRIVAVSSVGGKAAIPFNTPYISSKFALQGFCDSLRMELYPHAVSVTVVSPYWVVTEFHEAQLNKDGKPRGPQGRSLYTNRMMTADQCARRILRAAYARRRELLMAPGTLAVWLRLLAPGLLDWISVKMFLEPAIRRVRHTNITPR
jgi:short-subunit dehydrogenase